ncbi:enterochelin esterase domain-containing protein, partial [Citrobacter braakii]|uniref:enterochelin esterase domain-containing protein n=1 Tax=Citrobacter braakii TaxID=57706 RepID=UPI00374F921A
MTLFPFPAGRATRRLPDNFRCLHAPTPGLFLTATPQSMQRIDGTNVWCWSVSLSANWRGSYCFIPTERNDIFAA